MVALAALTPTELVALSGRGTSRLPALHNGHREFRFTPIALYWKLAGQPHKLSDLGFLLALVINATVFCCVKGHSGKEAAGSELGQDSTVETVRGWVKRTD